MRGSKPSVDQVRKTRAVVAWYLRTHFGRPSDVGLLQTFCSERAVGHMAVDANALSRGDDEAMFRLFVTVAMFQVLRDSLVMKILRGLSAEDAVDLTTCATLLTRATENPCSLSHTNEFLLSFCDLTKDPTTKAGTCSQAPDQPCYLKRHTQLLRRYGHFGKVPSSAALVVRDAGGGRIGGIYERVKEQSGNSGEGARRLERELSRTWRVNDKMASMFLSLVTAPDLGLDSPPWQPGIDWTWFVVVDRNVDKFLAAIGYRGSKTYPARRSFVRALARQVDLSELQRGLRPFNPRLVQQAMFLFMSRSNRKEWRGDCSYVGAEACQACERTVKRLCPLAPTGTGRRRRESP